MNDTDITTETENIVENEQTEQEVQESFEISEEVKEQSKKFFQFGSKPKKEKRKFESFEIVQTYVPKQKQNKKTDSSFKNIVDVSNNFEAVEESVSVQSATKKQNVKLQLRLKGKIILIAISIIIILLSSLSIFNAVKINDLNNQIVDTNQQITIEDANLKKAIKEFGELTSEEKIQEQSGSLNMSEVQESDIVEIELYDKQPVNKPEAKSNWFDKICGFLSNIFGG